MLTRDEAGLKNWFASGEPWVWMNAAAVAISIIAVVGLLGLIAVRGLAHFWPAEVMQITYLDGAQEHVVLGEHVESEFIPFDRYTEAAAGRDTQRAQGLVDVERTLFKVGNRRTTPPDFRWIYSHDVTATSVPDDVFVLERTEWGNAYGFLESVSEHGEVVASGDQAAEVFAARLALATEVREDIAGLEGSELNRINYELEQLRLKERGLALAGNDTPQALAEIDAQRQALNADYELAEGSLRDYHEALQSASITLRLAGGQLVDINLAEIIRA